MDDWVENCKVDPYFLFQQTGGGRNMTEEIAIGYDEKLDKFVVNAAQFDSMADLGQAVAELNLKVVKILRGD